MKRRYKISNIINFWDCTVEIDPDFVIEHLSMSNGAFTTMDIMKEMIGFWMGGEGRLDDNDGDVTKTFLQQLGREIFIILSNSNWNVNGVIAEFENREGWAAMNGSFGIKIIDTDVVEFSHSDFEVEEVES